MSRNRVIELTRGFITLVDEADYELLSKNKWWAWTDSWNLTYAVGWVSQTRTKLHHILLPKVPGRLVDHINGDTLDNRRDNLRYATPAQSRANTRPSAKSGFKGVYPTKGACTFKSIIRANGEQHYLGSFTTKVDAAKAYDEAARKFHGEFARLNFPK